MADNNFITGLGKSLLSQGASSLLSGGISHFFNGLAQDRATQASKELMREQYAYQRQNNLDAMTLARQSKEKAGFNVNADGSFSPSVNAPQAGQTALGADVSSNIQNLSRDFVNYEQAALLASQKKGQDIRNQLDQRTLDNQLSQDRLYSSVTYDEASGNYVVTAPVINSKLDFEALQDIYSWNGKRYTISAEVSQAKLQIAIANGQLENSELLQKLISMRGAEYDKVVAEIAQSDAMKELIEQQKETEISKKGLLDAQTDTEKERKGLVKAQTDTEKERKELVKAQTDTEKENKDYIISKTNLEKLEYTLEKNSDLSALIKDLKGQDFGTQITSVLMFLIHTASKFLKRR